MASKVSQSFRFRIRKRWGKGRAEKAVKKNRRFFSFPPHPSLIVFAFYLALDSVYTNPKREHVKKNRQLRMTRNRKHIKLKPAIKSPASNIT